MRKARFGIVRQDAHPYLAQEDAAYFFSLIARGADFMHRDGLIDAAGAEALKAGARSRISSGRFFGFISFNTVVGSRPA
ncbi:MAG: hypothetical protein LJE62_04880 [Silicimonas sp.]|jgi:hypothetical protein|nr:hypothetical protein [Silicimonas sp.]